MSRTLILENLPHAPGMGLWVSPDIPEEKLDGATDDYGHGVADEEVVALFDGTRFGSARDGILFLSDRLVSQKNNLHEPRTIRYRDVVGARVRRKLLGGRRVEVTLARGRTTVTEDLDFTVHGDAAEHVARLLELLVLEPSEPAAGTDRRSVVAALDRLVADGRLTDADRTVMLDALDRGPA